MYRFRFLSAFVGLLAVTCSVSAQQPNTQQPQAQNQTPTIDEKAMNHLKAMSEHIAGMKSFALTIEESLDILRDDLPRIQVNRKRVGTLVRPNRLRTEVMGADAGDTTFIYDGKSFALADATAKKYSKAAAPNTIDGLMEELFQKYGITTPLADFILTDPYKALTAGLKQGLYVGMGQVGDHKCHHLAFRTDTLDWQVWIDAGQDPLPRKFVMSYREATGQPQFTAIFRKWEVNPQVDATAFQFSAPAGFEEAPLVPVTAGTDEGKN